MPDTNRQTELEKKRIDLDKARKDKARKVQVLSKDRDKFKRAAEMFGNKDKRTLVHKKKYDNSLKSVVTLRREINNLKAGVHDILKAFDGDSLVSQYATLKAKYPIIMLPVRLETRFYRINDNPEFPGTLKVRVYPDSIAAQSHQEALTEKELELGHSYWNSAYDLADQKIAWTGILKDTSSTRAAWIVNKTEPTNINEFPDVPAIENEGRPVKPIFSAVELRPKDWSELTESHVLPDRWQVLCYRDNELVVKRESSAIIDPLALSLTLGSDGDEDELNNDSPLSDDGLDVDEELLWSFKYDKALEAGMAIDVPLEQIDLDKGFDRVIVLGVKTSLNSDNSATRISDMFDSHHYSRGFALLKQGSPTNNNTAVNSAYPLLDPNGENSFNIERGEDLSTNNLDGARLMKAFGIPASVASHIDGADRDEQATSAAMADALWPTTIGYFLKNMMTPHFNDEIINNARQYFTNHVKGRGPLSAIRIGSVPYGVLPVSALKHWDIHKGSVGADKHLPPFLSRLFKSWVEFSKSSPHINLSGNVDEDLLSTLSMDASSREAYIRTVIGPEAHKNSFKLFGQTFDLGSKLAEKLSRLVIDVMGFPATDPRVMWMNYGNKSNLFPFGFITDSPNDVLSETDGLKFNYISWLRSTMTSNIREHLLPDNIPQPKALLYLLLRHAYLTEIANNGRSVLHRRNIITADEMIEHEFVGITPVFAKGKNTNLSINSAASGVSISDNAVIDRPVIQPEQLEYRKSVWERLEAPVPGITAGDSLGNYLSRPSEEIRIPEDVNLFGYRKSLQAIENQPTAELERLFGETLDVCSHRIDAWVTSLASKRLEEMRDENSEGCYIGGYGWAETLRAKPSPELVDIHLTRRRKIKAAQGMGGSIYGPTMSHVAAGAILRNAFETRNGENKQSYAIDLSSKRVRTALWFMDSVRDGQPIGAVLGYHFERGLHERHTNLNLNKYVDNFQNLYPLVAGKAEQTTELADSIAARNVVDGLLLHRSWKSNKLKWGKNGIPSANSEEMLAIETELKELQDIIDAMSDILTAESVYQMTVGNTDGINATLDTMNKGIRPPIPEITHTPRSGTDIYHRVGVVLGGDSPNAHPWKDIDRTYRAMAEPYINNFSGILLGDPKDVVCECKLVIPDLVNPDTTTIEIVKVKLSELKIHPIDFLFLVKSVDDEQGETEIDRRIRHIALAGKPEKSQIEINYEGFNFTEADGEKRTFLQVFEISKSINSVLSRARPLSPTDLLAPEHEAKAKDAELITSDAIDRVRIASQQLTDIIISLDAAIIVLKGFDEGDPEPSLDTIRTALIDSSKFGIIGSYPHSHSGKSESMRLSLITQAESILAELKIRESNVTGIEDDATKDIESIFGEDFLFLTQFKPADKEQLDAAIENPPFIGDDREKPYTLSKWFSQISRIRPSLKGWRKLSLYAKLSGNNLIDFDLLQFPQRHGARWAGLPFESEDSRPARGTVSTLLYRLFKPNSNEIWCGLLLDDFVEQIPNTEEETAVAFNYDAPGLQAPQSILIVTPPKIQSNWDYESIVDSITQTLDMAHARTVDGEGLGVLSQMLPMTYVAANPKDDTISTPFVGMMIAQAFIAGQKGE